MGSTITFTVTAANGNTFKGELNQSQRTSFLTYLVNGKIVPPKATAPGIVIIEWTVDTVKDVVNTTAVASEIRFTVAFAGEKIVGRWAIANPLAGIDTLEGAFELARPVPKIICPPAAYPAYVLPAAPYTPQGCRPVVTVRPR